MGRKKLEYNKVVGEFLKGGCVLLQETYANNRTLMRYICKCGNESEITYNNFSKGHRCSNCREKAKRRLTYDFVFEEFLKAGCFLLAKSYEKTSTLMKYICKCGNESEIRYNNFKAGYRCANCGRAKRRLTYDFVFDDFSEAGCVLLAKSYKNSRTLMKYICKCGNESEIRYGSFRIGKRCAMCRNKTERMVKDFLEEQYSNIISQPKFEWCKNKKCLPFDFLLDDLKILIEVDGPQHFRQVSNWGSPEESLERDIYKVKLALDHGYSLIRISQADIKANTIDWQEMINDEVKEYSQPACVYISKDQNLYDRHKSLLEQSQN
jgi:very-short-patch-repair endonuclease